MRSGARIRNTPTGRSPLRSVPIQLSRYNFDIFSHFPVAVIFSKIDLCILDPTKQKWINHKGVQKLEEVLNLKETCGYITFIDTGVPDIGCEQYDINVHLIKPKRNALAKERRRASQTQPAVQSPSADYIVSIPFIQYQTFSLLIFLVIKYIFCVFQPNPAVKNLSELASPMDGSEITSFNIAKNLPNLSLTSPDENHFAVTPQNSSPANVYRSDDCNEILAKELEQLSEIEKGDRSPDTSEHCNLVSQSSIEIEICDNDQKDDLNSIEEEPESIGEVQNE